ncbi:acetate--CoA ligase family protein [Spartinivicinus poritis]|uniref:Acetate--CoA ligase family protein n=1 Tax=Spartinivicinus poritis TaxID=2994640 RepID=A0ABT5UB38_9GAMM|nr:acetate--CoA ligase family protein [Spartinivicinus sp. A2-2]MDE1462658.1 acetate--CoA ligase family protein [Spartinivicinus sp. A2-2]
MTITTTLNPLLTPQSIGLIGASNKPGLGHDMVAMIQQSGFKGDIYPINPRYTEVCGLPCYESLQAISKPVDLAVLCIAAHRAEAQVATAIEAGVKAIVLFANAVLADDLEPPLATRIAAQCEAAGVPLLGHNAMGFYNHDIQLRVCGFKAPNDATPGHIALITQSGSVFSTLAHNDPQLTFNLAIASGAETTTCVADFILYALSQPTTRVIGLYVETIRKPALFIQALQQAISQRIPVVAMKVGRSELGAQFALSHSGGMAGDDDALQAVFDHYGVVRVSSLDELANSLLLFSQFPSIASGGLMAVADSGGERNLLADEAEAISLPFATMEDTTQTQLQAIQEFGQTADNPLDPWGTGLDFERIFGESLAIMMQDPNAAIGLFSQDIRDNYFLTDGLVEAIKIAQKTTKKPIVFMTNFSGSRRSKTTERLNQLNVPVLTGTRPALLAIKHLFDFRNFQYSSVSQQKAATSQINTSPQTNTTIDVLTKQHVIQEHDALLLLKEYGFPTNISYAINNVQAIRNLQHQLPFPVVLKTAMPGVLHKADVGGVILNLKDMNALLTAYQQLSTQLGPDALIQPMQSFDHELIFGMKTDDTFGPIIIIGAGGILAEYLNDKMFLLPSASPAEIKHKLTQLKSYRILTGVRGNQSANIDALIDAIYQFCQLVNQLAGQVKEIDINPVVVNQQGVVALDALIVA